jgi:hypothetical protein
MNTGTVHLAPATVARVTGGFYLAYIVASVLATMLGQIGLGTASAWRRDANGLSIEQARQPDAFTQAPGSPRRASPPHAPGTSAARQ